MEKEKTVECSDETKLQQLRRLVKDVNYQDI